MTDRMCPDRVVAAGVGVVVPYDFAQDREMWRWVPEPLSLHVTRTPYVATPADAGQARMISSPDVVGQAVRNVLLPEPGVVAYSCTSGSFVGGAEGERALRQVVLDAGAPRAVTTAGALVTACAALGIDRLALATPYVEDLTGRLVGFLAAHGVHTVRRHGLGLLGRIWDVTPAEVVAAVRAADHTDADAVFVSCTNLPTYDVIAELETELGKPVLTANQVTMWAALDAIGVDAVGPGQALIEARGAGARPALRVVPDSPADLPEMPTGDGDGAVPVTLHKVRVRLPDESGALARLTAAVAEVGGNILSLSVHGKDSHSVVDEMLVGGAVTAARLSRVIRRRLRTSGPDAVQVVEADPHELVDAPTRALDLATGASTPDGVLHGLRALLYADEVGVERAGPAATDPYTLAVASPSGGTVVVRRGWAPFTVTERARAEAFLRATARPAPVVHELLLADGGTLVAGTATGDEVVELDGLLRTCLAGEPDAVEDWAAADLRSVLQPVGGSCLVARDGDGHLVAVVSRQDGDGPVVLVHPLYRGRRLGRWLRARLAGTEPAGTPWV